EKKSKLLSHLKYGAGKTITYMILGALFGLLGSFITFTPQLKGIAAVIAGLFLLIYGLNMLNVIPWLRKLQFRGPRFLEKVNKNNNDKGPFMIGLLNGLLIACGPLQAMLIYAAGTGSVIQGATAMLVFGLGTLPLMLGFGSIATIIGSKFTHRILKVSAIIVIILGVVMLNRGLTLTGSGYDVNSMITSVSASGDVITGTTGTDTIQKQGYQEIRMDVTNNGWEPDKFVLKKGVPVKWIINGKEINGCNNAIQVPKLNLNFDIKNGEQTIEFTPTEEGIISWSCWMGMIQGTFIVKEDIDLSNTVEIQKEIALIPNQPIGTCGGSCGSQTCGAAKGGSCGCGR
ncbi:MAG: sulfite exporter TauE/SafE family protein, partial [Nanoarchaeota archaeon]